MTAYLINHLGIPNGVPKPEGLQYLEAVEGTFEPYGGTWLVLDAQVEVLEGAWPGSAVLMEFPDMATADPRRHRGRCTDTLRHPAYQSRLPGSPGDVAAARQAGGRSGTRRDHTQLTQTRTFARMRSLVVGTDHALTRERRVPTAGGTRW